MQLRGDPRELWQGNRKVRWGRMETNAGCMSEQAWLWATGAQFDRGFLSDCGAHLKVLSAGRELRNVALLPASSARIWHHFLFWLSEGVSEAST